MARLFLAVCFALALVAAAPAAQQKQVLRSGVDTVPVYASVIDRTGRLVTGLTRDDFIILDDGKRQELALFTADVQPITIVVMLDRSGSVMRHFEIVRAAAEQFVSNLNDADRARIGSFSTSVRIDPVSFTSDRNEMLRILREDLLGQGPTPLWNAAAAAMSALGPETGRRVILMFTDGFDSPMGAGPNVSLRDVRHQARTDEIMLYGIGLATDCASATDFGQSGLFDAPLFQRGGGGRGGGVGTARPRGPAPRTPGRVGGVGRGGGGVGGGGMPRFPIPIPRMPVPRMPGRPGPEDPPGGGPVGRPSTLPPAASLCKTTEPDPGLREIAFDSGGGYFELHNTEALGQTFARVAEELHHQYLLGITPTNLDGRTHTLEVRMRDSNLTVRARRSYVAVAK